MTIIDHQTIEFSNRKLMLVLALSALMVLFGIWLAAGDFSNERRLVFVVAPLIGWATVLLGGLGCAAMFWQLAFGSKTALVLTKTGFTIPRYSRDEIPWGLVEEIDFATMHRNRFVVVKLASGAVAKIRRSGLAVWLERFAPPGLHLNAHAFGLSHDQLYATLHDHWLAAKAAPIGPAGSKPSAGE
ncbi:hypothetical protein EI545_07020 [Tabrizicola piscis]|uniref:PH domain-containing protein n=1 Tax=Tabrizicola piscis TaxID=2494374 RepID=A0A3S8U4W4_9RHOB|nr:STM3941 family protein [Tabrizicola piscis]AZL58608.1 hypothetical protein EI545_07020 [Tabrizicola piscis]